MVIFVIYTEHLVMGKQSKVKKKLNQQKIDLVNSIGFNWTSNVTWEDRFEELKQYKETHGDCCVPKKNETLGKWVDNQRSQYKFFHESKKSLLNQHRIDLLDSIGFTWTINVTWEDRFEELKQYKETHGDCCVPQKHGTLGTWTSNQRSQYKIFHESKKVLNQPRIDLLDSIGFTWNTRKRKKQSN